MKLDYYRANVLRVVVGVVLITSFYAFTRNDIKEPQPPKANTEVVGSYKECEIVQYTNPQLANYHYLLYCPQK